MNRVVNICKLENLDIDESGLKAIFKLCDGDMRKIVNMLQSISISVSGSSNNQ